MVSERTVALHRGAPEKPATGAPCNGCGLCCALEPCPWGRLVFRQRGGACPALDWSAADKRYRCGLVVRPRAHLPWLPVWLETTVCRWFAGRIGAGCGCDCEAEIEA